MTDDHGREIKKALPSTPVEIIGLNDVPIAGDIFKAFDHEKKARQALRCLWMIWLVRLKKEKYRRST